MVLVCVCEACILCRAHQQRWIDQLILPNLNENFSLFWEMVTVKKKRSMFLTKNHSLTLLSSSFSSFTQAEVQGRWCSFQGLPWAVLLPTVPQDLPCEPAACCAMEGCRLCSLDSRRELGDAVLVADSPAGSVKLLCSCFNICF